MSKKFLNLPGVTKVLNLLKGTLAPISDIEAIEADTDTYVLNIDYEKELAFDTSQISLIGDTIIYDGTITVESLAGITIDTADGGSFTFNYNGVIIKNTVINSNIKNLIINLSNQFAITEAAGQIYDDINIWISESLGLMFMNDIENNRVICTPLEKELFPEVGNIIYLQLSYNK